MSALRGAPSIGTAGGAGFSDVDGDGRMEVLVRSGSVAGTWSRTPEGGWSPFRLFRDTPNVDFADPDIRLADLTGDGRAEGVQALGRLKAHHFDAARAAEEKRRR